MAGPLPQINARAVDAVLESLRRGHRQLARDPRGTVEGAVKQLLSLGRSRDDSAQAPDPDRRTYRIDELASLSGVTVRNIRAYQERGLLPAPERRGRVALFDDAHLSRLRIITSMLERGYSAAHITEMLSAWEQGKDLADVIGLEGALVSPRVGDDPVAVSRDEARELSGGEVEMALLADAGLLELTGETARLIRPDLLHAFAEMRGFAVPTKDMVRLYRDLQVSIDQITRRLVDEGVEQVAHRFLGHTEPSSEEVGELVMMLTRFRELALGAVGATLARSLEARIEEVLGDYLAAVVRDSATGAG